MSCSNPIHYVEVNVIGPSEDFPFTLVNVWVNRAHGLREYSASSIRRRNLIPSFYRLGLLLLGGYLARTAPWSVRREVVYVPNR